MDDGAPGSTSTPRRSGGRLLLALAAAIVIAAGVVRAARERLERATAARVDDLLEDAAPPSDGRVSEDDLLGLPAPVRRYLGTALADGQPHVETARLTQRGELRLGGAWKPFSATQHVSVRPPGFVWDATVSVFPLLPARVVDAYEDGAGSLTAWLCSTLPVAAAASSPEVDEGELLRYLGESPWYPTALLADAVEWEAIDDRTARATIAHGGNEASLEFRFDDRDLVASVHAAARYRQEDGSYVPWTGHFREYRERSGTLVPVEAEVEWHLPDGDRAYWRGRVESIEYGFVG